ncbi:phosphocholine-specific phospholipase C [Paraburkholderia unamae]|uniref:phospholipase C n=1 Tax=Paraburkholderia unamae TaxID=219649 RepID=A0ABX5KVJ5_9BURK|nr:phospholipase C, phosphocholine-specific [Paraburkholderia unamae]PVX86521.1 phospholipase C [Paraburkholderia unamae]RAR68005.1 phospholipase C [Paraburkholderia unamae]CAG9250143.1 Non-hemolytic phospholipase C [Paraburkholderia unamae]
MNSRRKFLQNTATAGLSAAALSAFPPSIRRALAIPAHYETGTIKDVKHVVLLMMENRSFDSYFGTQKGVRGYGDRFAIPAQNVNNVFYQTYKDGQVYTPYHLDATKGNAINAGGTPHTWSDAQAAWSLGRMNQWPVAKTLLSMGYYESAEVPFQRALTDAFTLCDHYHCSMHTGTIANRLYYWTGTNGSSGVSPATGAGVKVAVLNNQYNDGNDVGLPAQGTTGWTWTTYADRLAAAGVNWKVYQSLYDNYGCNEMMSFQHWRQAIASMPQARRPWYLASESLSQYNNANVPQLPVYEPSDKALNALAPGFSNTMPDGLLASFIADIQNGTLPEVSWIIPPSTYSEHPGVSTPATGGWYIQAVLDALTANPEVFSKTVLLVNYDENDGFFDHLPPPSAPARNTDGTLAGASTLSDAQMAYEYHNFTPATASQPAQDGRPYGPGPRVPMWVISPWSRGGWVNSQVFDHTSTLMFLEKRFGVKEPQITAYRRAICGDLTSAFNFAAPNNEALPTLKGSTTQSAASALVTAQSALPAIPVTPNGTLPVQDAGVRPSRALPYELNVQAKANLSAGAITLKFVNTGRAGAVFHVYDKLNLANVPRRYVVEPGKSLEDNWAAVANNAGKYDLWVLGPNGFHRHIAGNLSTLGARNAATPEVVAQYGDGQHALFLSLRNDGGGKVQLTVKSNAIYGALRDAGGDPFGRQNGTTWVVTLHPGEHRELGWDLKQTGNWYDFLVTSDSDSSFARRFAGRVETGRHSVSDPGMGRADSF